MSSLKDGLGGDEILASGLQSGSPVSPYFAGSVTSESNISGLNLYCTGSILGGRIHGTIQVSGLDIYAAGSVIGDVVQADVKVSGAQVFSAGSVTGARITDANGLIKSIWAGSPAVYGYYIQAGSVGTSAGSAGTVVFGALYSSADYLIHLAPLTLDVDGAGSVVPTASGTKNVSGCEVVGAASTVYSYFAVGK